MALKHKKQAAEIAHSATIENLDYNTQRTLITIPEYGRGVQKMVEAALKIEDREKRNKAAQSIVSVMGLLNPQVREITDYKQKLWDHLHIIADFKLDVDAPYPQPERQAILSKPNRIAYPSSNIRYKYYGKAMEDMIRKIADLEDGPKKDQITQNLANFMKMSYLTWNKDTVDDATIFKHMDELSTGKVMLHESVRLNHTAEILALSKEKQRDNATKKPSRNNHNKNKRRKK